MRKSEWLRWLFWGLTGVGAVVGLVGLGRKGLPREETFSEERLSEAFWKAEAGLTPSPTERAQVERILNQITDSLPRLYALAVTYTLLYADNLSAPPMLYVQRLQQLRADPWVVAYLGRLAWHTGQKEKARAYLHEAIQRDSACGPAYLFLTQVVPESACVWLQAASTAALPPGAVIYQKHLREQYRCP
ncbi:MAG: hypothetical protein N3A68_02970 [Bacteroidia bacterium]|nr:hypothetical protein [Bacteroidia bacterium]GIV23101.1 MAG: hypothetical protein KatS3mg025_0760 [Bacteroidia bacterium]